MEKVSKGNKSVRAVPEGYHTVTPYLVVDNAEKLLEFMTNAFDGKLLSITRGENQRVMHATVKIGDSIIMVSDTMEGMQPQIGMLYLYLEEVDKVYEKAIAAKATSLHEPTNEFYGDRAAAVKDAWGNVWWMATHVEDVDEHELKRRAENAEQERKSKGDEVHA